ncbi:rhomboid family intramembrane serine protease [Corynebacterium macginleyi]|uniref:rhomboid family intramembrane serine protease n=1 Tax=Corynebacterium macginleyi TaxID=38290 RepID=UPI001EF32EBB|nr:rhomboid family intramembrane serine protease [Corynebacterium macginleyi]
MVKNYLRTAPVTSVIALICIIAWSITAIQARTLGETFFFSTLSQDWALWGPHYAHAPLTALSSEFMHLDGGHLAVNMVMLLLIGREVERALDTGLYVAAYLVSCLGASAMVLWFDGSTPTVGASGAIFALMGMLVGVFRQRGMDLRAPIVLVLINVGYTFVAEGFHCGDTLAGCVPESS